MWVQIYFQVSFGNYKEERKLVNLNKDNSL